MNKVLAHLSKFRIGLRTTKSAVAVFFCLLMQFIFSVDPTHIYNAAIAAIVCMRENTEESFLFGVQRFIGTIIGGVMGLILISINIYIPYYEDGLYLILVPLFVMFCISICAFLNKKNAVIICCVVFLGIVLDTTLNRNNTLWYIIHRVFYTTIGIVIATLLNQYFFPHDEDDEHQKIEV
ncbi:FUSC family protein [Dehalobacterium formicoaceticum]|uniref:Aromatic acid exporter family protein n=1 Tax=Dehalobacterium formicoaceticum TaxID=51515 RepID=A0ABT1Y4B8_9FIRM|nr:aromatic acid exporter family protein [Dehalobacterium formicoaceticum]MCR6545718.1 aromatic acid exporter family protein [Dehalobacterium formicoaceticum]